MYFDDAEAAQLLGVQSTSAAVGSSPGSPELGQEECWAVLIDNEEYEILLGEFPAREVKTIPINIRVSVHTI